MEPLSEPTNTVWPFPFTPQDWEQTPPAVQAYVHTLHDELAQLHERVDTLEARLKQNSTTSSRPPSSDSPYKKPRQRTTPPHRAKRVGNRAIQAIARCSYRPRRSQELRPERCACGNTTFALTTPYHTHQVIELPPIAMEVTHWVLHQGWCPACGRWSKAQVPAEHATWLWTPVQCPHGGGGRDVWQRPAYGANLLCLGAAGAHQLGGHPESPRPGHPGHRPHYTAIATQARQAPVNYIDETPWFLLNTLQWLWVMASDTWRST